MPVPMRAAAPSRLGLGVGMDMPWAGGTVVGFDSQVGGPSRKVEGFLRRYGAEFSYLMFSFQPRGPAAMDASLYVPAYDRLVALVPAGTPLVLHQTTLNLAASHAYDRQAVYRFTNALHARYGFQWVVEDIGIWSQHGIPMPYPLPPFLTEEALERTIANVREARAQLAAPLHIEFPGFSDGFMVIVGELDAYDYFRRLADAADVAVTLDVGHLLSYRWLRGHRGEALFGDLDRLPLERCRELHLSGCAIARDKFLDLHHGVLLDEQLALCELLLERCPSLVGVTYEDPAYSQEGVLVPKAMPNVHRLRGLVEQWMR